MPKYKTDMTGARHEMEVPPSSVYDFQIVDIKEKSSKAESKEPGMPMLNLQLEISDGEFQGKTAFKTVMLPHKERSPESNKRCKAATGEFLQAVGHDPENGSFDTDDFLGKIVRARCVKEEGPDGRDGLTVKAFIV